MTHSLRKVYVGLFLAILVAAGGAALLAARDYQRPAGPDLLDGGMAHAFETYYDEHFPLKRVGTNLWAAAQYLLFGEGRDGVIVGRDGWLYSDEEFEPVAGARQNLQSNWELVQGVAREMDARGIELVLAFVPAKVRLYPEHAGQAQPSALRSDLYGELLARAHQSGIEAPDLLTPLRQAKAGEQVFLRTDTHWTPQGAAVAAQTLADSVAQSGRFQGDQAYVTERGETREHRGDLLNFLPLDPLFGSLLPAPDDLQQRKTTPREDAAASADALFADSSLPVALVGTSYSANPSWNFAGALRQDLSSDLANYAEDGKGPILPMLEYLSSDGFKQNPPRLVIWEIPERYLPFANDLSGFDPQWIAHLRAGGDDRQFASSDEHTRAAPVARP